MPSSPQIDMRWLKRSPTDPQPRCLLNSYRTQEAVDQMEQAFFVFLFNTVQKEMNSDFHGTFDSLQAPVMPQKWS